MQYHIFNQTLYHEDIGTYQTYGIECYKTGVCVNDVSLNRSFVESIVKILDILQVEPAKLTDTVSSLLFLEYL